MVHTLESLKALKRPALQQLCREHGIKGLGQKSDILIRLLLDAQQK